MFRVRSSIRLALLTVMILALPGAGCIFSPDKKDVPPPDNNDVYPVINSAPALIENLRLAYQKRDVEKFITLLHPDYQFHLNDPPGEYWGYTEEIRIHQRMFDPQNIPPTDPPLSTDLWLTSVDIQLQGANAFDERPEVYRSATNQEGLEEATWDATGADYTATVFFETQGETDYRVEGRADFIVARDRTKAIDAPGAWLIYRWFDLGPLKPTLASAM